MLEFAASLLRGVVATFTGLLIAGGTLTLAADRAATQRPSLVPAPRATQTLTVPQVSGQAYVFAKGILQDAGFAWKVEGPVRGYAANTVTVQQPLPGTRVVDTGAPLVVLRLVANSHYDQHGLPEDASPYRGTEIRLVHPPVVKNPVVVPKTPVVVPKKPVVAPKKTKKKLAANLRPPAFVVAGERKEPLDEIPLTERAQRLRAWLGRPPKPTTANVRYWLYQNSWIVTGARFGWWHGAEALRVLIAANVRAQQVWGIGLKSKARAEAALAFVEKRSR